MNKNRYLLLFIICLFTGIVVTIGMPGYSEDASSRVQNGVSSLIPLGEMPVLVNIAGGLSFVVAIWGIIMASKRRQWLWLVSFVFFTYISVGIYSLLNFIRLFKKEANHKKTAH